MKPYALQDAQTQLQLLIEKPLAGQMIMIQADDQHLIQLVPLAMTQAPRKAGSARRQITLADDFDAPIADFDAFDT